MVRDLILKRPDLMAALKDVIEPNQSFDMPF